MGDIIEYDHSSTLSKIQYFAVKIMVSFMFSIRGLYFDVISFPLWKFILQKSGYDDK